MKLDDNLLHSVYPDARETAPPVWLITFADLVSLMLVFFVMLVATSSLDQAKFQRILGPRPMVVPVSAQILDPIERSMEKAPVAEGRDPDYLLSVLKTKLESEPVLKNLPLASYGDRVVLRLPADRVVAAVEDDPAGKKPSPLVFALGGLLQTLPNQIVVDGFVPAGESANRWQLALNLAMHVAASLQESGVNSPVLARAHVGFDGEPTGGDSLGHVDVVLMDMTATNPVPLASGGE